MAVAFSPPPPLRIQEEEDSVGQGAGGAEVGEELETEADHKVPDVAGHLRAGDEHPPDEHHQQGVEGVADVPQSERGSGTKHKQSLNMCRRSA